MGEIIKRLKKPFSTDEVKWRVQSCGISKKGNPWAMVLAYIDARAVMDRLDEVVGPENWKRKHDFGPNGEVLCGIAIRINDEWIWKWDGAAQTNIEGEKGGLSDSFKRSGVSWGISRYLYKLEEDFANCTRKDMRSEDGWIRATVKPKNNKKENEYATIYWQIPKLPEWARPKTSKKKDKSKNNQEEKNDNNKNNSQNKQKIVDEITALMEDKEINNKQAKNKLQKKYNKESMKKCSKSELSSFLDYLGSINYICNDCEKRKVTEAVKNYCKKNKTKFNNQLVCRDCRGKY